MTVIIDLILTLFINRKLKTHSSDQVFLTSLFFLNLLNNEFENTPTKSFHKSFSSAYFRLGFKYILAFFADSRHKKFSPFIREISWTVPSNRYLMYCVWIKLNLDFIYTHTPQRVEIEKKFRNKKRNNTGFILSNELNKV